jgi:hypothetical protein
MSNNGFVQWGPFQVRQVDSNGRPQHAMVIRRPRSASANQTQPQNGMYQVGGPQVRQLLFYLSLANTSNCNHLTAYERRSHEPCDLFQQSTTSLK